MQSFDAQLLAGFGGLRFGASEKEVERVFGQPEESEVLEALDESRSLVWHYWSKGFSVFFDQESGGRFCSVEADRSVNLRFWGKNIFETGEKEIKALLKEQGYKDMDEENHEWGEKRLSFDDAMVDFYFEKGILVSVNFGVMSTSDIPVIHSN